MTLYTIAGWLHLQQMISPAAILSRCKILTTVTMVSKSQVWGLVKHLRCKQPGQGWNIYKPTSQYSGINQSGVSNKPYFIRIGCSLVTAPTHHPIPPRDLAHSVDTHVHIIGLPFQLILAVQWALNVSLSLNDEIWCALIRSPNSDHQTLATATMHRTGKLHTENVIIVISSWPVPILLYNSTHLLHFYSD